MENKAFDDIELQAGADEAGKEKAAATAVAIKEAEEQQPVEHDGPYAGMGKDVLLKYSQGVKWQVTRWLCLILLTAGWFVMLAMALVIIVTTPKCLPWWQLSTFYQIYPRSFYDSDGDGVGDLKGITLKADYLSSLGIGAVLLNSIYASGGKDFGYDVTDFAAVDKTLGTMGDFEEMLSTLHDRDIKVVLDFIPNHSSDQHPWFQDEVKSKEYYTWRDAPNNWVSLYSGSAWHKVNDTGEQYYFHQYSKYQPDFNFANPAVEDQLLQALEEWFIKGVDGFNLHSMKYIYEDEDFKDEPVDPEFTGVTDPKQPEQYDSLIHDYTAEYAYHSMGTLHDMLHKWRKGIFDQFSTAGTYRIMLTDSNSNSSVVTSYYGTSESREADMPLNFNLVQLGNKLGQGATTQGTKIRKWIEDWMQNLPSKKWPNFVLGNHEVHRVASRLPSNYAAAANMLLLTLPGTPICYYGDEIGMEDVEMSLKNTTDIKGLSDPERWRLTTRDPERSPMQWNTEANAGFSENEAGTWLPVNKNYLEGVNVEAMEAEDVKWSILHMFKSLVHLRKSARAFQNPEIHFVKDTEEVVSYVRETSDGTGKRFFIAINFGAVRSEEDFFNVDSSIPIQGTVIISTDGSRQTTRGGRVELNKLPLAPGEGLVIQLDDVVDVPEGTTFLYQYFKPS